MLCSHALSLAVTYMNLRVVRIVLSAALVVDLARSDGSKDIVQEAVNHVTAP